MLTSIAEQLDVSLPSLLGVGVEYVASATAFFERMRQLEEHCDQAIGLFSPVSYLLTSDRYDESLKDVLKESIPDGADADGSASRSVDALLGILKARKRGFRLRRPLIASLIASSDLERFLLHGLIGRHDLAPEVVRDRRMKARYEAEHIVRLLRDQPIGIQIGIVRESVPATSYQIFRQADRSVLAGQPLPAGRTPERAHRRRHDHPRLPEALRQHEDIAARLWSESLKGAEAADFLEAMIEKYAIPG